MSAIPMQLLSDNATVGPDGNLSVGGCSIAEIAAEYGTPVFVYDEAHLRARCQQAVAAFGHQQVVYATKAFLCKAMARLVYDEGLLLDVASGGELAVVLAAGVPANVCTLHGNNKSMTELREAITAGVRHIIVDSFDELDRLDVLAAEQLGPVPKVLLRITPGVSAHTHEFIATGQDDSKFGFNLGNGDALKAVDRARRSTSVELVGVHCHIGSNVFEASSFAKAAAVMADFAVPLDLPELVLGGGLGVAYIEGEEAPTIAHWGNVLLDACQALGVRSKVSVEPGRAIAAAAAMTVYSVGTVKHIPGVRTYISVDGGMSDNPRPVLYGSGYESFLPRAVTDERAMTARLVGKHCESGDVLSFAAQLPADTAVGDLLAMPVTGAYGHSMGSNYNKITRPPVVFAANGDARLVVRRETYDDLLRADIG
ncbi:MAG: diaminopimelate decarboxylase [Ilumatobacter sp.]|jgi:diaminopimelate decarboxylase|uniref:diaminopimelate decarboxylase n=2 Tax=Ilumatobacter sp. TaxID=1967498 RepID=UPI001DC9D362|nr:diaminopimelate decarboxylase [Ilumatobacter sp.]MBT5275774.1 diaminopimelate decarboxylase [Ilumatobacter sp.]MBT5553264.1 diaminopimelate decarboxylase [Ilumatobacter sp.]MBT7429797.1 diaminopimelate decarboxylase [Ilumatobacter sp.]MDG0975322.1 diaminopimelate decarboxylase [Ilumatobacter sp.]